MLREATKGYKMCQENVTRIITTTAWTGATMQDGSMLSYCLHQILLSNFYEPMWTIASVSCSYLVGVMPGLQIKKKERKKKEEE